LVAKADNVRPIPDSLDAARASGLGVAYKTAWACLADAELAKGEILLVQAGSSGTGQAAIDIGRYLGATVYATASPPKHARIRDLGAEPLAYDDEKIVSSTPTSSSILSSERPSSGASARSRRPAGS
jgi:NADPH:quinone reductase-like Zn-dependent oxidoreductase